jgi:hypothetical protein
MNAKNRRTTLTWTAFAFLCLGIAMPASKAVGQQKPLRELIVGTWFLDAVYDQTQDGEKHNPWGEGVKGQAIFTSDGHFSWRMMSANRPKADTVHGSQSDQLSPTGAPTRSMRPQKTLTDQLERCTFPQWDGITGTLNLASPTENELNMTTTKPIPDPKMGPFVPHINWKRAN